MKDIMLRISDETHLKMRKYTALTSWSELFEKAVNEAIDRHITEMDEIRHLIQCQPTLKDALERGLVLVNDYYSALVTDEVKP